MKTKIYCLIAAFILTTFSVSAQTPTSTFDFSKLKNELSKNGQDIGKDFAVIVTKNGSPIFKYETDEMKMNTQIPIASCSKWLTAALVMTFVDEGKLNLDDKVSDYLPIFSTYGKKFVTIRHCLTHQTGIEQEPVSLRSIVFRKKFETLEEEVKYLVSHKEIDYNPGEYFYYGAAGLNIAARVCEIVGKKSFQQLMNERICRKLSMRATTFESEDMSSAPNPSGGARSTAQDYSNFLVMLANKGMFKEQRILSEQAISQMESIQMDISKIKYAPKVATGMYYGFGNWLLQVNDEGKGQVVSSPGLFGTFPLVDYCKGYTLIIATKSLMSESKKETYLNIKSIIDEIITETNCK